MFDLNDDRQYYITTQNGDIISSSKIGLENTKQLCKLYINSHKVLYISADRLSNRIIKCLQDKDEYIVFEDLMNTDNSNNNNSNDKPKSNTVKEVPTISYFFDVIGDTLKVSVDAEYRQVIDSLDLSYKKVLNESWDSKYNSYMSYNYEPFAVSGFTYSGLYLFKSENEASYAMYLLDKRFKQICQLEKILLLEANS